MSLIDMPLHELEQYEGSNPKPKDFDAYWEAALAEMRSVNPNLRMEKAGFESPVADCYDLYFTGVNGAQIRVMHLRPKQVAGKIPALLMFHGYTDCSGSWTDKLAYAASGHAVFAMDVRGQGGQSEDVSRVLGNTHHGHIIRGLEDEDPNKLFFRDVFLDTAQLADLVIHLDFIDEKRVYTSGGSQGGALALVCAALEPRVSKVATAYPFLSDYRRVYGLDLAVSAYAELSAYFKYFDPQHKKEEEIFRKLGYIDVQHLAPRVKGDVLFFTCLMDVTCPPSTQYAVFNKLNCRKEHILYPDYEHQLPYEATDLIYDFLVNY